MGGFPKLEASYALRASTTGAYLVLLLFVFEKYGLTQFNTKIELAATTLAVGAVVGFLADLLSLYKLNPIYRTIRKRFFLYLYEIHKGNKGTSLISPAEKIKAAEQIREDIIYSFDAKRSANLRSEHAMWIVLYNIGMLSIIGAASLMVVALISPLSVPRPYSAISTLVVLTVLATVAAIARNNSYNDKLLNVTHAHTPRQAQS
jgi:hypothetical protein